MVTCKGNVPGMPFHDSTKYRESYIVLVVILYCYPWMMSLLKSFPSRLFKDAGLELAPLATLLVASSVESALARGSVEVLPKHLDKLQRYLEKFSADRLRCRRCNSWFCDMRAAIRHFDFPSERHPLWARAIYGYGG